MIVDRVRGTKVHIRDPWPLEGVDSRAFKQAENGVEGMVDLDEFAEQWANGFNFMFKIKKQ